MFIAEPTFTTPDPGLTSSQIKIHVKEFKYFYHPGLSSIPDPDPGVKKKHLIPNPGSATLKKI
jgi:hypothetical protein